MLGVACPLLSEFTVCEWICFVVFYTVTAGVLHIQPIFTVKTMYHVSYIRLHLGLYSVIAAMHIIVYYRNSRKPPMLTDLTSIALLPTNS